MSNILHYYDTLRADTILDPVYTHRIAGCALLGLLSIESVSVDWSQDGLPREFTTLFAPSAPPLVTSTSAHVDPHWLIPWLRPIYLARISKMLALLTFLFAMGVSFGAATSPRADTLHALAQDLPTDVLRSIWAPDCACFLNLEGDDSIMLSPSEFIEKRKRLTVLSVLLESSKTRITTSPNLTH